MLCGKEYGSMSINIHIKNCKKMFEISQKYVPLSDRKNVDKIINAYYQNINFMNKKIGACGKYNIDEMNNQVYDMYNNDILVECQYCGRKFHPDRLSVHQRVCRKHPEMFNRKVNKSYK